MGINNFEEVGWKEKEIKFSAVEMESFWTWLHREIQLIMSNWRLAQVEVVFFG